MKGFILIYLLLMAGFVTTASAENLLMTRSNRSFDVTLEVAKDSIAAHGYTVSHIQRCDGTGDAGALQLSYGGFLENCPSVHAAPG